MKTNRVEDQLDRTLSGLDELTTDRTPGRTKNSPGAMRWSATALFYARPQSPPPAVRHMVTGGLEMADCRRMRARTMQLMGQL